MKKILQKIHLYLALTFGIIIVLQGLSGSILVFEKQIDNFLLRQKHDFVEGQRAEIYEIINAGAAGVSQDYVPTLFRISPQKNTAAYIRFNKIDDRKSSFEAFIDPVSLQVIEIGNPQEGVFNFIKKFHTNLLLKGDLGRNIIGSFGIILLILCITGIILWWPKLRDFKKSIHFKFTQKKSAAARQVFHRDLHKTFGFWLSIFLLISTISGIYLSFPKQISSGFFSVFAGDNPRDRINKIRIEAPEKKQKSAKLEIEKIISEIIAKNPQLVFTSVMFPGKADQPVKLNFIEQNDFEDAPTTTFLINQNTSEIIAEFDPSEYKIPEKVIAWQPYLHEGRGLGMIWKIIVFICGLSLLLFAITGVYMWLLRKRLKRK
jgi:uncharacterized iron-regulated membrane protein